MRSDYKSARAGDIEELHELVHGQGYSYHEIEELIIDYFGK